MTVQQGYTQTTTTDATADVTGSSLDLAKNWFSEGKTLKFKVAGTKTGANLAMSVVLYLSDGAVMTLTSGDADAGDWIAEFEITALTLATQRIMGTFTQTANAAIVDYDASAKDLTTGAGPFTIKVQIVSAHAADTVTSEMVNIQHWVKAD